MKLDNFIKDPKEGSIKDKVQVRAEPKAAGMGKVNGPRENGVYRKIGDGIDNPRYLPNIRLEPAEMIMELRRNRKVYMSLSAALKEIGDAKKIDKLRILFNRKVRGLFTKREVHEFRLDNPYPDWVNENKKWSAFGTFTDYMVRKMIALIYPEKVHADKDNRLIAEGGLALIRKLEILRNNLPEKRIEYEFLMEKLQLDDFYGGEVPDLYNNAEEWIRDYKEAETWEDAMVPAAKLVNLDMIFREARVINRFVLHNGDDSLIEQCRPFFRKINSFVERKFSEFKSFLLNPTLGHPYTLKADADLIADDCLFEIKTSKYPGKYIKKGPFQLMGYVGLITFLQYVYNQPEDIIRELNARFERINLADVENYSCLNAPRITKIAYFFPLGPKILYYDIDEYNDDERIKYLFHLLKLLSESIKINENVKGRKSQ